MPATPATKETLFDVVEYEHSQLRSERWKRIREAWKIYVVVQIFFLILGIVFPDGFTTGAVFCSSFITWLWFGLDIKSVIWRESDLRMETPTMWYFANGETRYVPPEIVELVVKAKGSDPGLKNFKVRWIGQNDPIVLMFRTGSKPEIIAVYDVDEDGTAVIKYSR
ncbi:hypothetical protein FJY93_01235 [Candidatus Kaiserbacteria bacterium]|nr:hypothetical protein [Candidatus Kaiserbacteria bacterium]